MKRIIIYISIIYTISLLFWSCNNYEIYSITEDYGKLNYNIFDTLIYTDTSKNFFDTLLVINKKDTIVFNKMYINKNERELYFCRQTQMTFILYTDTIIRALLQTQPPVINFNEKLLQHFSFDFWKISTKSFEYVHYYEYHSYIFYLNNFSGLVGYKNKNTNTTMYLYKHLPYKN